MAAVSHSNEWHFLSSTALLYAFTLTKLIKKDDEEAL